MNGKEELAMGATEERTFYLEGLVSLCHRKELWVPGSVCTGSQCGQSTANKRELQAIRWERKRGQRYSKS